MFGILIIVNQSQRSPQHFLKRAFLYVYSSNPRSLESELLESFQEMQSHILNIHKDRNFMNKCMTLLSIWSSSFGLQFRKIQASELPTVNSED